MDGRNNQFNPHNTQNRQLTNFSAELNHILQNGVSPEQYAENARQLESYRQMNTMALQVYLQRQAQQDVQHRQEEQRTLQIAQQQLASGGQQRRQLQPPPPAPPPPHSHRSSYPQQAAIASVVNARSTPMVHNHGQSYATPNISNAASQHWTYQGRTHVANVQHQLHPQPVNTSVRFVHQNVYSPREATRVSHPIGGTGGLTAPNPHTSQVVQPPRAAQSSIQQPPQYSQHSGVAAIGSQNNTGGSSVATASHGVHHKPSTAYDNLKEIYPSWVEKYGAVKAASMARECMQPWLQERQIHPSASNPIPSTTLTPMASMSAQIPQNQNPFQIPKQQEGTAVPISHPQTQKWHSSVPVTSNLGDQEASQTQATAPPAHAPSHHPPTDVSALDAVVNPAMMNVTVAQNDAGMQSHHPEAIASNPTPTSAVPASTASALPNSQSILLASEEKESALYTLRGLAASIKRSLNAERLAAPAESSASSGPHTQKRKRSSSAETIDNQHEAESSGPGERVYGLSDFIKTEPQPVNTVSEPDDSRSTILPGSFPETDIPQQETRPTPNEFAMPNPHHASTHNFQSFSTLTGAVSFDVVSSSSSANHNTNSSSEAPVALEDLSTSRPTTESALHNDIEVPLIHLPQSPFDPLSFPHRTPTPPLAATITLVRDEDEVDEKAEATPSSHPSSLLHEEEVDSQLRLIPSGSEDGVGIRADSDEVQVQTHFNVTSPPERTAHSETPDDDSPMHETDVFVRRTGLLDSSNGGIHHGSMGSPQVEECPAGETRSSTQAREELPSSVPTRASSSCVRSPGFVETSGTGLSSKVPRKTHGKREFYIAVPPPSEWVLRAKRREAERKAQINYKTGQHSNREYTECELANRLCPRHCHWNGCQAVLNSMYALKQHVRRHQLEVEPVRPAMTVSCRWKQCRMVCERSSLLLHLNRHIDKGVTCVYDDCDEHFSRIRDLAEHEKSEHANDEPPPSAVPRPPDLKSLAALPQSVPSYTTTTRPASRPSITAERHARLGPWTLGMIIGHPAAGADGEGSNTGLRARRTTRLTEKAPGVAPMPPFPGMGESGEMNSNLEVAGQWAVYDILEEPCVGRGRVFGELDTVDVTREFYKGCRGREVSASGSESSGVGEGLNDMDSLAVEALL